MNPRKDEPPRGERTEDYEKVYADCAEQIVELEAARDRLADALKDLVNKLDKIHDDPHYKSVWFSYANHGGDYSNGPKYDKELAVAKAVLAKGTSRARP